MRLALASSDNDSLVFGATPRAHLLPVEVAAQRKAKSFRRNLLFALGGVVVIVIGGVAFASAQLASANADQLTAQSQTAALSAQQRKYGAVTSVQGQVQDIKTVQPSAVQGEILWGPYLESLQATLPAGVTITQFTAALAAPATPGQPAADAVPLQGDHVATLSVTATGPQAAISQWLASVTSLKGVVNSNPGAIAVTPEGLYKANVDLLIGKDMLAQRFTKAAS
jgi:Tfp pilus assembly protein PilN